MSLLHALTIMRTIGFISEIPDQMQAIIMEHGLKNITPKTDFIVYKPEPCQKRIEDEAKTLITHIEGLDKKVYAKLDDYGNPNEWDQMYDEETACDLKKSGIACYIITFMLASEY
jgi:hypothetical protein